MANYTTTNTTGMGGGNSQVGSSTAFNCNIATWASTVGNGTVATVLRRGKLYDMLVGTAGTPADNYVEWEVRRVIIGSTVAPQLAGGISSLSSNFGLDTADNYGAATQVFINSSVSGMANTTFNQQVWYVGVNQRASYRWVAAPGSEIVWPASSSAPTSGSSFVGNGITGNNRSAAYTGNTTMTWLWQEQ